MQQFFDGPYPASHPELAAIRTQLGRAMRRLRKSSGLSAKALAEEMKFSPQYLYQLERGEKELNSFHLLQWASLVCRTAVDLKEVLEIWATYNELEDKLFVDVTSRIAMLKNLDFTDEELDAACLLSSWIRPRERARWPIIKAALIGISRSN